MNWPWVLVPLCVWLATQIAGRMLLARSNRELAEVNHRLAQANREFAHHRAQGRTLTAEAELLISDTPGAPN